ncbi:unnamed protein product [Caenorhabditis angaria]|uniref:Uncharacterized protein n=1 Tax=Caenorhabditis angaria TaxID=860376 RepID=A0A9P1N4E9_9PELO|nr:unnamed protein product [Caenorhabditis angaria]
MVRRLMTKCSSDGARPKGINNPRLEMIARSLSHETSNARRKRSRLTRARCIQSETKRSNYQLDVNQPIIFTERQGNPNMSSSLSTIPSLWVSQ